jgi:hypothetical protein
MLRLVNENVITFERLPYYLCEGYNLKITYSDGIEETIYIQNTKASNFIKEKQELEYNSGLLWTLPDDICATSAADIKVYINSVEISTNYYNYNISSRMMSIDSLDVTPNDTIEVEFDVDKMQYVHNSDRTCEYYVYPIFKNNYKIGQHTKL